MRELREFEKRRLRHFVLRAVCIFVAVLFVVIVAVVNETVSLRSLLPAYALPVREEKELRVHFLSVGQADLSVVEFPSGELVLIDTGAGSWKENGELLRYYKGLGKPPCTVVLTHDANDHTGGADFVLKYFDVKTLYLPFFETFEGKNELEKRGIEVKDISRYTVIGDETAYLLCLSPRSGDSGDENDCSAVLSLSYAGVQVLFAADIPASREKTLVEESLLDEGIFDSGNFRFRLGETDVLKVAHHGSDGSSSEEFLSAIGAKDAVISCGAGNTYGHPALGAVERLRSYGMRIWRTDELGDILLTISSDGTYRMESGYLK